MSTLIATTLQGINTIKYDGSTTAMTIDSTGRVLTPARPAFGVRRDSSDQSITGSTYTVVEFETEELI